MTPAKLLFLIFSMALPGANRWPMLLLKQVYLNGQGPFRMLVDTGAESSALRPAAAARIGATAQYRVEQVSVAGSVLTPAGTVAVQVGGSGEEEVEMLYSEIRHAGADGILGQSWLRRHSYLLDFESGRLTLDGEPPAQGLRLDYRETDGRPSVMANIDGVEEELVVDSGADVMVLFREEVRRTGRVGLATNTGNIEAGWGEARVEIGRGFRQRILAAEVAGVKRAGLLPASIFRSVYVAKNRGTIVLVPRT